MCDVREYFERSMLLAAMKQRVTFLRPAGFVRGRAINGSHQG